MTILLFAMTTSSVTAQNATTNATNAVGNASASVNQTASELRKKGFLKLFGFKGNKYQGSGL